jgi:tripartite-type tricarboxylate transporter receptor subunit TctC
MKLARRSLLRLAASSCVFGAFPRFARALDYPKRPVRIIVGFPAASGPDIVARLLAERLSERLGQQFTTEDRPGAGSSIAAETVVKAPPDGYTLFMATAANTINTSLYPNLSFDFARDLAPVAVITATPFVLIVNPLFPPTTMTEFIAYAKAHPGKINFASPGIGTSPHLAIELLRMMAGVDVVHVPYRGSYVSDLIAGQVNAAFSTVAQAIEYIKAGKVRAVAIGSATRVKALPDVPTVAETLPGFDTDGWFGLVAPKATPAEIVNALNAACNAIVAEPKLNAQLVSLGTPPKSLTPAEFGKLIVDYTEKWAKVIKFAGVKPS